MEKLIEERTKVDCEKCKELNKKFGNEHYVATCDKCLDKRLEESGVEKLIEENARLREALRYYAETNYEVRVGYDDSIDLPDICFEKGRRARQALEGNA